MRTLLGITALVMLVSSPILSAHESFRIIGTIVKFEKWRLEIKTVYDEPYSILLQPSTPIERNKKPATVKELKAGLGVVVQVVGDTPYDADLYVASVTIVPPIPAARAK